MQIKQFIKDWTLPVSIALGTGTYLLFHSVPLLHAAGDAMAPVIDTIFPLTVFLTLLTTFCRIDFHQMRPHRWHAAVLAAYLLTVAALCMATILTSHQGATEAGLLCESLLACAIGPAATASPVVTGKLGGNINTMTAFVVMSSAASAVMIPAIFPLIEQTAGISFLTAFTMILQKVALVLILPLVLGWIMQHKAKALCQQITSIPDLSFHLWCLSLTITAGITIRNILHSHASPTLLATIAAGSLMLCMVLFILGRTIGHHLGEEVNSGQALFQKNTALCIWVSYTYLNPVASVGAGCYVLWQNIVNSIELWQYRKHSTTSFYR